MGRAGGRLRGIDGLRVPHRVHANLLSAQTTLFGTAYPRDWLLLVLFGLCNRRTLKLAPCRAAFVSTRRSARMAPNSLLRSALVEPDQRIEGVRFGWATVLL